jgi:hypothetical protein
VRRRTRSGPLQHTVLPDDEAIRARVPGAAESSGLAGPRAQRLLISPWRKARQPDEMNLSAGPTTSTGSSEPPGL